ncbi:MAG: spore coat associated protein CotJA [Clostridia bacterium]
MNDTAIAPENCHDLMPRMVLAMVYVLDQMWCDTYEIDIAHCRGTIFPSLDKPFIGEAMPK